MHLLAVVTPHGFGHASQVAPVIGALRQRLPGLRVTVSTTLPEAFLRGRIPGGFEYVEFAADFGLIMKSALEVDTAASEAAYAALHNDWQSRVEQEARRLQSIAPDVILADVPYLTLAGARQAAIPAVALCSLNWADIYRSYFGHLDEAETILRQIESAYQDAQTFLCPEPSMPMPFLPNRVAIGPIAAQGCCRREELLRRVGANAGDALVLVAPGGVETRFAMEHWPAGQDVHWLVSERWRIQHPDVSDYEKAAMGFTDLVASCDAVLGKCGYGTVTECVVNSTPLMYIPRPDWPEEDSLQGWLESHHAAVRLDPQWLDTGNFRDAIELARSLSIKPCRPTGADQAADYLSGFLAG
jgi:hypothetical protein